MKLCIVLFPILFLSSGISFIFLSFDTGKLVLGLTINAILIALYGSPLTMIFHVIKSRNAASIDT
jgi:hypothetical protein